MKAYQTEFIELAREYNVLKFGEFTLKSGRTSPYFFNAGAFASGRALAALGRCYARRIVESGIEFDVLLGPAYKGIPLAAVTAVALADDRLIGGAPTSANFAGSASLYSRVGGAWSPQVTLSGEGMSETFLAELKAWLHARGT